MLRGLVAFTTVTIVGAGLAGCEAAYQLAERGVPVRLREMKPKKRTPAQTGDGLAELVCSNSLRGAALTNAVGLLKEELRRAGSLIMRCALQSRVPAGGALAVDREVFSSLVTAAIRDHERISLVNEEVTTIPEDRPCILATGPLTSDALAADVARVVGDEHLAYYDAIAPIVSAESIDWDVCGSRAATTRAAPTTSTAASARSSTRTSCRRSSMRRRSPRASSRRRGTSRAACLVR